MNNSKEISLLHLLKKLIPMCFSACPRYIIAFLPVSIFHGVTLVASTITSQYFFDIISVSVKQKNSYYTIIILICFVILLILQQLSNGVMNFMGWHMELKIKKHMLYKFHIKISKLKAIEFETTSNLDMLNKAFQGANNTMEICGTLLMLTTFYVPYFICMGIYLFSVKPLLILSLILIFIPNLFTQVVRIKVFTKLEDQVAPIRRIIDYNTKCFLDSKFLKETRQWGAFNFFINILKENIELLGKKSWESELKTGILELLLNVLTLIGYLGILFMLVYFLIFNEISIGAFAAIFASIDIMFSLMQEIICFHFGNLTQNTGAVMSFLNFMELPESQYKDAIFDSNKGIDFNNVSFTYPYTSKAILKNINLRIKKGETIAIVGENGSGKSTLSKLLIGLYEPTLGLVTIGGCDTKNTTPEVIFNNISGVFQTYQRYQMTVRDNISISNSKVVQDQKVIELAKYFSLMQSSEDSKAFLDTMLSREFDGIDLSGGQWQRISIARGLYRNHGIIVLDKPTASIDPIEEKYIFNKFSEITKGKTSVLITHRLGAVKIVDRIIVMSEGQIKEEGTHESLISLNGIYATMYKEQSVWYE